MYNVLACESCGALYAAFRFKDLEKPFICDSARRDRPGPDGICRGELREFGSMEPWKKY